MKKTLRIIAGTALIILGLSIVLFSTTIWPQPFNWSTLLLFFAPAFSVGVAFIAIGWAVLAGMSRQETIELIMFLWR